MHFSSLLQWNDHMSKHHSRWPQYIHRQKMWKCEPRLLHNEGDHLGPTGPCIGCKKKHKADYTHGSVAYFSSASHFMAHLKAVHKHTCSDVELKAIAAECGDEQNLHAELCPLCFLTPQGLQATGIRSMQDHIANHLQVLMLLSLRLIQICTDSSEDTEAGGSSCDAVANASQVSVGETDEDREQDMTELPSPPSDSPTLRPVSPTSESSFSSEADETLSWDGITSQIRQIVPMQETVIDQLLDKRKREQRAGLMRMPIRLVTDEDIGLRVLRDAPAEAATEPMDIVAVHGIGAHPDDSWCKNVGTEESPHWVNWLVEERMLPAVAPHARIMRYGYQSQWFGESAMGQKASIVAHRLLLALQRTRKVRTDLVS
jgi:hypothetical protein